MEKRKVIAKKYIYEFSFNEFFKALNMKVKKNEQVYISTEYDDDLNEFVKIEISSHNSSYTNERKEK